MLCKTPGVYEIDKLRVIQLIEADLNMYLRLIWGKRLVHHALHAGKILVEQFGSKPGSLAMSTALLKVLTFDLIRLTRSQATIFNNDAQACYDRILPVLSQICCQRLGLPPIAAKFKLEFLQTVEYYVKTRQGISDDWFGNALSDVYGALQGSGAAPAIWLAVSIVLIRTYNELHSVDGIPDPTNTLRLHKIIDAFVDDTNLWDILFHNPLSDQAAISRMQHRSQTWEKLIFLSGGTRNPKKCYWYYVKWNWKDGLPELCPNIEAPGDLVILSSSTGQPVTITQAEPTSSLCTLGLWTSPSSTTTDQFLFTATALCAIMARLRSTTLNTTEAAHIAPVYLHSKLRYIFAGTTFTKKDCKQLDNLFLPSLKSQLGYNNKTLLAIMHGAYIYGGCQLPTSWDLQGTIHLNFLLGHLQLNDLVGQHISHAIDYLYLLLGLSPRPLSYDYATAAPLMVSSWIAHTWHYLSSLQGTLVFSSLFIDLQREGDVTIMSKALALYGKGIKLLRINAVRLYLQAFYLSDIVTSDGKHVAREYTSPSQPFHRSSLLTWPHQIDPGLKAWREWRTMLRACYTHQSFALQTSLGRWLHPTVRTQSWDSLMSTTTSMVYEKRPLEWASYRLTSRSNYILTPDSISPHAPPPPLLPVTLIKHNGTVRIPSYPRSTRPLHPSSPLPSPNFRRHLSQLPSHERWVIGHVHHLHPHEATTYLHMIRDGKFVIGSDGSVNGQSATYSSRLQSRTTLTTYLTSHSRCLPTGTLRTEAYGYLGALYLLRASTLFLQSQGVPLPTHTIHAYIDNK